MTANIVVSFFIVFVDDRGISYTNRRIVARKYISSSLFAVDVLSVIPLYFVVRLLADVGHTGVVRAALRLNRMIGLIRVAKFLSKCRAPFSRSDINSLQ